jgi:gluconolactonase
MDRRTFLGAMAAGATATALQASAAATERPRASPYHWGRCPAVVIRIRMSNHSKSPRAASDKAGSRASRVPWPLSASPPACAGPKARCISRPGGIFGHLSVFRQPSMNSNGNTIDREGRLITCEHGGRRVTRTELDGSITVIADKYNGKKLNSPNDVAVASDGSIWFTDPVYGIGGNYEGIKEKPEQEKHNVYRADPKSGDIKVVVDDFGEPNGITFSPDEKKLYVIDTGFTDGPDNPSHIRVFDVDVGAGTVSNSKVFAEMPKPSITDDMRADTEGNIWCSMGWGDPNEDGVRCYNPAGELLGRINIPETVANLCFGGMFRNRLYICGSTSLYAVYTSATGAMKP